MWVERIFRAAQPCVATPLAFGNPDRLSPPSGAEPITSGWQSPPHRGQSVTGKVPPVVVSSAVSKQ